MLREDRQVNRLTESLNLFEDVANSPYFVKSAIILFLNKTDLFRDKLKQGIDLRYLLRSTGLLWTPYSDSHSFFRQECCIPIIPVDSITTTPWPS